MPSWQNRWAIGIYTGDSPLDLAPAPGVEQPVLTGAHVTDVRATTVADPFLVRRDGMWYLFFEVLDADRGKGAIAFATSRDGLAWDYGGVVLREDFHLSYPFVVAWDGADYMIPESGEDRTVRLYRCRSWPDDWRLERVLLHGPYRDATVVRHDGAWWMFALRGLDELRLHRASELAGPWTHHPASPLHPGDRTRTRPGGRLLALPGRLVRFAQDAWPVYGARLRAFEVERLDEAGFRERELPESPVLEASGEGWNALCMHHLDVHPLEGGRWLAAVDGATVALL